MMEQPGDRRFRVMATMGGIRLPTRFHAAKIFLDEVKRSFYACFMKPKERILQTAEDAFDRHGFTATGMDRLSAAAELSSRTLYKQIGSKNALITAVLKARSTRFFARFDIHSVDALFAALEDWTRNEGARGCLFLRAESETGGELPEISNVVTAYRKELRDLISRVVAKDTGQDGTDELVDQMLVLFEGAISAASYRGANAVNAARSVAAVLVKQATMTGLAFHGGPLPLQRQGA